MNDSHKNQAILAAIERVEHPAISTTLLDLGIVRDTQVSPDGNVTLTLALPFPNIPDHIRDYIVNSLAAAAESVMMEFAANVLTDPELRLSRLRGAPL